MSDIPDSLTVFNWKFIPHELIFPLLPSCNECNKLYYPNFIEWLNLSQILDKSNAKTEYIVYLRYFTAIYKKLSHDEKCSKYK